MPAASGGDSACAGLPQMPVETLLPFSVGGELEAHCIQISQKTCATSCKPPHCPYPGPFGCLSWGVLADLSHLLLLSQEDSGPAFSPLLASDAWWAGVPTWHKQGTRCDSGCFPSPDGAAVRGLANVWGRQLWVERGAGSSSPCGV